MMQTNQAQTATTTTPVCKPVTTTSTLATTDMYRVACPARGVSDDHHPGTAYFLIHEDAAHGQLLHCSHPECGRLKRSFRYCAVCKRPVSKRNFHTRHDHGFLRYDGAGKAILPSMSKVSLTTTTTTSAATTEAAVAPAPSTSAPVPVTSEHSRVRPREEENTTTEMFPVSPEAKRKCVRRPVATITVPAPLSEEALSKAVVSDDSSDDEDENEPSVPLDPLPDPMMFTDPFADEENKKKTKMLTDDEQKWLQLFRNRPDANELHDTEKKAEWLSLVFNKAFVSSASTEDEEEARNRIVSEIIKDDKAWFSSTAPTCPDTDEAIMITGDVSSVGTLDDNEDDLMLCQPVAAAATAQKEETPLPSTTPNWLIVDGLADDEFWNGVTW